MYIMKQPLGLRFYHPDRHTTMRRGNLPHLEQPGVCAFITFMLADAIPRSVAGEWKNKRACWCRQRGLPADAQIEEIRQILGDIELRRFQRMVSASYHRALDRGAGSCLLVQSDLSKILSDALHFHDGRSGRLFDYVIMPNHVHVLFQPSPEKSLRSILESVRSYSARQINQRIGRKGSLWDREPFDHLVRSLRYFRRYQHYIRANPVRAGLSSKTVRVYEWNGLSDLEDSQFGTNRATWIIPSPG
jgi:type I restriction enzyme R subunit